MSADTKIEWADHTFNPWEGCQKVGPGCDNCYAEKRNARFGGGVAINWGPGAPRRRTSDSNWQQPIKWNREAQDKGVRYRVFCASLADVFDNAVDPRWRDDLFVLIAATPNLDWLLLTKRIANVPAMVGTTVGWLPTNVWLGITVVDQAEADRDIAKLLAIPAAKRFLSMEPLLGHVNLQHIPVASGYGAGPCSGCGSDVYIDALSGSTFCAGSCDGPRSNGIDWVIVGGESGPKARPMHPDWVRSLRDQCGAYGVPFLFKQWGEHLPVELDSADAEGLRVYAIDGCGALPERRHTIVTAHDQTFVNVGKKAAGRHVDGRTWDEVPS